MRLSLILALASSAASAFAAVQTVVVGRNGTLTFSPANFTASIGDTVTFEFHAKNHTVTQSTFPAPCTPFVNASSGTVVNSGFVPVAANATTFPTYSIKINSTSPLWFFCAQVGHCGKGMVGAINAPTTGNTYQAFLAKALALGSTTPNSTSTAAGPSTPSSSASSTPKSGALPKLSSARSVILVSLVGVGIGLIL